MIQITQCKINVDSDSESIRFRKIAKALRIECSDIKSYQIIKKSLDARKKPLLYFVYTFAVETTKEDGTILRKCSGNTNISKYNPPVQFKKQIIKKSCGLKSDNMKVVIVGSGPAGLFAAYVLALAGEHPIILERGEKVEQRVNTVQKFWEEGILNKNSNVSFGEGGAGTFSDGKLNTGIKDKSGRLPFILQTFVDFGAPEEILYESKPHIGTDLLRNVVSRMRGEIERLGGTFHFHTTFLSPKVKSGQLQSILAEDNVTGHKIEISCNHCILAIGHSARDTLKHLYEIGLQMESKAFAVGVRVEHLQKWIDENQYGTGVHSLPASDYKLATKTENGRGVYSFCMCPGGFVVNASQKEGELVINGMSNYDRSERNANSAIIVTVKPEDFLEERFANEGPMAGVLFQKEMEKEAWNVGKGKIPVQVYKDFIKNQPSIAFGSVTPNTKGGTILSNVRELFPDFIGNAIEEAMPQFGKMISGFDNEDTLILGVETRTSSPVRIVRNKEFHSNIRNMYPCGEGAGYAGGIMSAAMDGCKVAMEILTNE